jgi:hypothetical protein
MEPTEKLWDEFLNLGESFQHLLAIPTFGYCLIKFTTKMLMDTAPSDSDCMKLIKEAVDAGIEWHVQEQNEDENS